MPVILAVAVVLAGIAVGAWLGIFLYFLGAEVCCDLAEMLEHDHQSHATKSHS